MTDELAERRQRVSQETAADAGIIANADRIDARALCDTMSREQLEDFYVAVIEQTTRLTAACDKHWPIEDWPNELGARDVAAILLEIIWLAFD